MSMVNIDSYIDSRRIKFVYRIINEPIESCNAIGKYRLSRFDLVQSPQVLFHLHVFPGYMYYSSILSTVIHVTRKYM
jgi:hypothetical protein